MHESFFSVKLSCNSVNGYPLYEISNYQGFEFWREKRFRFGEKANFKFLSLDFEGGRHGY